MRAIESDLSLEGAVLCSVGAGAAGEESLLSDRLSGLILIEPDPRYAAFLRETYPTATVIEAPYEDLKFDGRANVIYAASLGPWMNGDPMHGVDPTFTEFCKRNLAPGGAIVALIYGGMHCGFILDKRYYLERLVSSTDYIIALYGKYRQDNALLVLTDRPHGLPRLAGFVEEPLILNGVIVTAGQASPWGIVPAAVTVASHALRKIVKVLQEAGYLLRVNWRLRR